MYENDAYKLRRATVKCFYKFSPLQMEELSNKDLNEYFLDMTYYRMSQDVEDIENGNL